MRALGARSVPSHRPLQPAACKRRPFAASDGPQGSRGQLPSDQGMPEMSADLERLGPIGFQDLAAALLVATFGPGVEVMGDGRDGGRDLYIDGPLTWIDGPDGSASEAWDGYTVFQIKHKQSLDADHQKNASWFWGEIRNELNIWANAEKKRDPLPDQLVFVTNVPLTPFPGSGGHDTIRQNIHDYKTALADSSHDTGDGAERKARLARISQIRKIRFWDGTKIGTLLNANDGVRRAFPGFLTAGDVLASLQQISQFAEPDQLGAVLQADARTSLVGGEGRIYFDEAADATSRGVPIHDVAIDLPITRPADAEGTVRPDRALNYVLSRGEHVLKPSAAIVSKPRHIVLVGSPGNGKTTLSKLLTQAYRSSLLRDADDLSDQHREAIDGMQAALRRLGRGGLPRNRRWPVRVDLARHAQEFATDERSLLRYIAMRISERSDLGDVKVSWLASWMRAWPCLFVLDGLDEVTEPAVRQRVLDRVRQLVADAEGADCDLLVVLTTRPTGYFEDMDPTLFEQVQLGPLRVDQALGYGELTTRARLNNDLDRIETVLSRLRQAAENESMINLLQTPLQVLIMTIIFESSGNLARDRYSLFWEYYEVVVRRERSKEYMGLRRILQENAQQIQQLHERVGFELQVISEVGAQSAATLTQQELRRLTWTVLHDAQFEPDGEHSALLDDIVRAATHRLVLLAPRPGSGFGFDVRSLQELMAAKYLVAQHPSKLRTILRIAAPSPHWRNTWIFAAGSLYSVPLNHQYDLATEVVEGVDTDARHKLASIVPIGPSLAMDLIDDGMTRSLPAWRNRLIKVALGVLKEPVGPDFVPMARAILRFAASGDAQRRTIVDAVRDALSYSVTSRATAERLQRITHELCDELQLGVEVRGIASVLPAAGSAVQPASDGWDDFAEDLLTQPMTTLVDETVLAQAAETLQKLAVGENVSRDQLALLRDLLEQDDVAVAIQSALTPLIPHLPRLVLRLRDTVLAPMYREPIGTELRDIVRSEA